MKAYEQFLRGVGTPIGLVGAVLLLVWFFIVPMEKWTSIPPTEVEWTTQCEQLGIGQITNVEVEKVGGQHFCVATIPMEDYPVRQRESVWKAGCVSLGGSYSSFNAIYTCYKEELVESLGARETYGETQ